MTNTFCRHKQVCNFVTVLSRKVFCCRCCTGYVESQTDRHFYSTQPSFPFLQSGWFIFDQSVFTIFLSQPIRPLECMKLSAPIGHWSRSFSERQKVCWKASQRKTDERQKVSQRPILPFLISASVYWPSCCRSFCCCRSICCCRYTTTH